MDLTKVTLGVLTLLAVLPSMSLSQEFTKADKAIKAVKDLCLTGTQYDLKADAQGNLTLLKLSPGATGSVSVNARSSAGAAAIFDEKLRKEADEDIRNCIKPYIQKIIDAILQENPASSTAVGPPMSGPAVSTPHPLTPGETAIDDRRTFVPESTLAVSFRRSTINGVFYTNALLMRSNRPGRVEINAGRSRSRFLGDLGVPDDQEAGSAYQVDVSFDNAAPVLSTQVSFGQTRRLDLDVTNVLRIKISISPIAGRSDYLAIGNPRFR